MSIFLPVTDDVLSQRLKAATQRVVFIAPAVSESVVAAIGSCLKIPEKVSVTVVVDPNEDAYRIGYGDLGGLLGLKTLKENNNLVLRSQSGLRIGLLLVDDDILVWSPTPQAVEGQRKAEEPNGLDLSRELIAGEYSNSFEKNASDTSTDHSSPTSTNPLADIIRNAVGGNGSDAHSDQTEIGREPLTTEKMDKTMEELSENPPVPVDLAQKTRVLSTKIQFVEFELRGALWTKREVKLSSLLLNADLPEELQDLFETRIKPFSLQGDVAVEVPSLVQGQVAYNREGELILSPMTQGDIEKAWKDIRGRYLKQLPGFGWIIHKTQHDRFLADVEAYETVLKAWVDGFREKIKGPEEALIKDIVKLIERRYERSPIKDKLPRPEKLKGIVVEGIQNLRVTEPSVKLVFKEISWESTRDNEFTEALSKVLTDEELEGWFKVFTVAKQRNPSQQRLFPSEMPHRQSSSQPS